MDDSRIAFKGTLQQLLEKVEKGEMIPKLQASHAPPCKFWTAFQVLNGIRHMAPVIHGPKGCTTPWLMPTKCVAVSIAAFP